MSAGLSRQGENTVNILKDHILARAASALESVGDPSAAQSIECLRDVLTADPKLAASLEKRMTEQLVKKCAGARS